MSPKKLKNLEKLLICIPRTIQFLKISSSLFSILLFLTAPHVQAQELDCIKIAVLPKPYKFSQMSDFITKLWRSRAQKALPRCAKIMNYSESSKAFSYLFKNDKQALEAIPFTYDKLNYLKEEFGITHIAVPHYNYSKYFVKFKTEIYVINGFYNIPAKLRPLMTPYTQKIPPNIIFSNTFRSQGSQYLANLLLPNSVAIGISNRTPSNQNEKEKYDTIETEYGQEILPFNLKTGSILPPRFLDDGDATFYLTSNFSISNSQISYILAEKENPTQTFNYRLTYLRFIPTISLMFAIESAIGQFQIGLGAGLIFYNYKDNLNNMGSGIVSANHFPVAYQAFLSQNLFFEISVELTYPHQRFISNEVFNLDGDFGATIGFGYYINQFYHPGGYYKKL